MMFNFPNYGLIFWNAFQTELLLCRFERQSPSAQTGFETPMCLHGPEEINGFPMDEEIGTQTILFVEYMDGDLDGVMENNGFVECEVTCDEDFPASEFVREYVQGGTLEDGAHDLFTTCLLKLMQDKGAVGGLH